MEIRQKSHSPGRLRQRDNVALALLDACGWRCGWFKENGTKIEFLMQDSFFYDLVFVDNNNILAGFYLYRVKISTGHFKFLQRNETRDAFYYLFLCYA